MASSCIITVSTKHGIYGPHAINVAVHMPDRIPRGAYLYLRGTNIYTQAAIIT
jgi:hypothetical protein